MVKGAASPFVEVRVAFRSPEANSSEFAAQPGSAAGQVITNNDAEVRQRCRQTAEPESHKSPKRLAAAAKWSDALRLRPLPLGARPRRSVALQVT